MTASRNRGPIRVPVALKSPMRVLALIAAMVAGGPSSVGADLRVVGSDLMGVEFSKALYGFAGRREISVALALDGSRPGLGELKAGRAQLALCVFAPGDEREAADFARRTVAYHRVVVLAPAAAPVEQVTLAQLAGVFGVGGPPGITDWGGLGARGAWQALGVVPLVPAAGAGIGVEYFRQAVLAGRAYRTNAARYERLADLAGNFQGESRVLALAAAPLPGHVPAKLVAVASRPGQLASLPTAENVHSGDYPLRLALVAVYRRESAASVRWLLEFLMSDDATREFERAHLVPLPASVRRRPISLPENP
ncbi:MAG: hypothetical protein HZA93_06850 [Verrucomicrobia bacterium]|nr:hypothetical protein [Verrucomicrobiota bacterium]